MYSASHLTGRFFSINEHNPLDTNHLIKSGATHPLQNLKIIISEGFFILHPSHLPRTQVPGNSSFPIPFLWYNQRL